MKKTNGKTKRTLLIIICAVLVATLLIGFCSCGTRVLEMKAYDTAETAEDGEPRYVSELSRESTGENYGYAAKALDDSAYESTEDGGKSAARNSDSMPKSDYKQTADAALRKLIRDASMDIETQKYDEFYSALGKAITENGGYVQSSNEHGSNYNYSQSRSMDLKVRIPADNLDAFINSVSSIATVTAKSVSVRDVTGDYIDTEGRIKALETEYDALLAILAKADTVADLITVQNRLTEVNAELESCKSRLKNYDDLIAYSTVTMQVYEVERVTAPEPETFGGEVLGKLKDNLIDIADAARAFAVWFISSLPDIILLALFGTAAFFIGRRVIKKRRPKKQKTFDKYVNSGKTEENNK
jgi:hypothetical protein